MPLLGKVKFIDNPIQYFEIIIELFEVFQLCINLSAAPWPAKDLIQGMSKKHSMWISREDVECDKSICNKAKLQGGSVDKQLGRYVLGYIL